MVAECQSRFPVAQPPGLFPDYESLLACPDIDAVYIPLPTGVRKPWVVMAAQQGKHVLCEKPCAASTEDMREMVEACARAGVQFMDNVMFVHSLRMQRLQSLLLQQQRIGAIRRIATQFSFLGDESFFAGNIRSQSHLEPWGCLGDLGWYCIRICLLAMNDELPVRVRGRILNPLDGAGVPVEFSGELDFAGGVTASLYCSFRNQHQQWVHVSGTEGSLMVDDFVLPSFGNQLAIRYRTAEFNRTGYDFNYERRSEDLMVDEYGNGHPSAQEVRLVRRFAELVRGGIPDPYWPTISLKTQRVMQALWDAAKSGREQNL
jgi:predicted dehydrogenase